MRRLLIFIIILLLATAGGLTWWLMNGSARSNNEYRTATIDRGSIIHSVVATGTLNPVKVVNVGTQVSGTVAELFADFNDRVEEGQILLKLDPSLFEAEVRQNEANLAEARASLTLASQNLSRNKSLYEKKYVAKAELDAANQQYAAAKARMDIIEAQLERAKVNLSYSIIRSPVAGRVISRDIDIGQTVAASFQTPTLFKIAQDLSEMQIDTSLSEADVGLVKEGMQVKFTVDAFPDRTFDGIIRQVRLNPTNQQNVVTYNVVVGVQNKDLALLPGMTAFVTIEVANRPDAVRVPNAALRFRPADATDNMDVPGRDKARVIYLLRGGKPVPVQVKTGVTDNRFTELTHGEVSVGDTVITGYRNASEAE